jgi:hypothetical protein
MKIYCIKCQAEKEIVVALTIYNRTRYKKRLERKIKGNCSECWDEMCRVLSTEIKHNKT